MSNTPRINFWWDDDHGIENEGWYAEEERFNEELGCYEFHDDSMKAWFPVDVNSFTGAQGAKLRVALRKAFPEHDINWEDE